jgi:two-component sensor histidine kinase
MGLEFPLDPRFPNYHVVHGKRPLALADIRTDFPHFTTQDGEFQSGHIRSWLGVPLLDRGEVTGMLTLDRTTVAPFNADDIEIAQALANHVAAALSNARLYERLQRANNLQQMLLRELHHRVKNNLQLISSLLSLRSRDISEESADLVQELRTHIHAMAATHDNLFQPGLSEDVQLEPYLTEIIHGVRSAYVTAGSGIRVETDLDDKLRAGMRQAVPIGLIASEMVLNAIKHAFPDSGAPDRPNVIRATLTRKPGIGIELTVGDTGTGIPNAAEPPSGFGLTLIETLAQQLKASLTVEYFDPEGERGTLWTLIIP